MLSPSFRIRKSVKGLTVIAVTALAFVGLGLPPALGSSGITFRFSGAGFGHGLGLSQYGAKGMADAGYSFDRIAGHYYQNTSLGSTPSPAEIRVGLAQFQSSISIGGTGRFDFIVSGSILASGSAGQTWIVRPTSSGGYRLEGPNGWSWTGGDSTVWMEVRFEDGSLLTTGGRRYKYGWLELNTHSNGSWGLRSILHISPFEKYLYGLGEMPSSWHLEALKAQTVAARTYAIEKIRRVGVQSECNCHLYATTRDQAYVGYDKEASAGGDRWVSAVDSTAGIVIFYSERLIQAFYSSSSGGHTENNENVWGGSPIPYLRGVPDPWDRTTSPYSNWTVDWTSDSLDSRLSGNPATSVGHVTGIEFLSPRGVSGRVTPVFSTSEGGVRIVGSEGTKRVSGDLFRSILGLRSTLIYVDIVGGTHPDGVLIQGPGPQVFVLRDGTLWPVPTEAVFDSQFRWSEIVRVSDQTLSRYPTAQVRFREGSLIGTPDGKVWVVSGGLRRHVASEQDFNSLGYSWGNLRWVSYGEAALHQVGARLTASGTHPDGSLVGASSRIFYIEGGKKRYVPSPAVLESRFRWGEVIPISDSEASVYPDGAPLGFRDGSLVGTPDGKVWVISGGLRRHVLSEEAFNTLGLSWSNVRGVSEAEAAIHPEGEGVWGIHPDGLLIKGSGSQVSLLSEGTRVPVPSEAIFNSQFGWHEIVRVSDETFSRYPTAQVRFREGSLIGTPDGKVWVVSGGLRRHVASEQDFNSLGYSWGNLRWVGFGEAALHQVGARLTASGTHPDGSLVGASSRIFYIEGGKKRYVSSPAVLESRFRWGEVIPISDSEASVYPDGAPLGFRDGSLIRTPDGKVWVISAGLKRHVPSEAAFNAFGFSWSNVRWVSEDEGRLHAEGPAIV